jgi:Sulfotransferase family
VLVTGMHRSGTTWAGHMLCGGGDFVRLGEPLSPVNRQTILTRPVTHWYTYINDGNEAPYLRSYQDALRFRAHPLEDIRRARLLSPRDPGRILARWASFTLGRARGRRVLFHDPFAIFSAEWFARRLSCQVVVLVRHPLSIVSGLKRLGWAFDFRSLSEQPDLMNELLPAYREEIEEAIGSESIIEQGCLLWRIVYETVSQRFASNPSIHLVRHEDLSIDPHGEFRRLYELLGAEYDERARATIERNTSGENPPELRESDPDGVRVDSRANLGNWRHRLDDDEVARIVESTRAAAALFYSEDDVRSTLGRGASQSA